MTLLDVLSQADGLRPNTIPADVKAGWVYEQEMAFAEMMGAGEVINPYPENGELLIDNSYAVCYVWQLCARIDLSNKDLELYAADRQIAEEVTAKAMAHYRRSHRGEKTAWRT